MGRTLRDSTSDCRWRPRITDEIERREQNVFTSVLQRKHIERKRLTCHMFDRACVYWLSDLFPSFVPGWTNVCFVFLSPAYCLIFSLVLRSAWDQCHDAEVILESPYAFAGVHIAEALCMCFSLFLENYFVTRKMNLNSLIATAIPYFRVCTMPWSKTTQFPHPFISPPVETSKFNYNNCSMVVIELWSGQKLTKSSVPSIYKG